VRTFVIPFYFGSGYNYSGSGSITLRVLIKSFAGCLRCTLLSAGLPLIGLIRKIVRFYGDFLLAAGSSFGLPEFLATWQKVKGSPQPISIDFSILTVSTVPEHIGMYGTRKKLTGALFILSNLAKFLIEKAKGPPDRYR
jgi:hypothetical protein